MNDIYFTSDTHFGHNRPFVYQARGFSCIEDMNETFVENWNRVVTPSDRVYHLGDTFLDSYANADLFSRLNGKIHLLCGNHDTKAKVSYLLEKGYIVSAAVADVLVYKKRRFWLSHYPCITTNIQMSSENLAKGSRNRMIDLYGHTHQLTNFFVLNDESIPFMYHVGVDSHGFSPVHVDTVISDVRNQTELALKSL